jgi:hypothetical protein
LWVFGLDRDIFLRLIWLSWIKRVLVLIDRQETFVIPSIPFVTNTPLIVIGSIDRVLCSPVYKVALASGPMRGDVNGMLRVATPRKIWEVCALKLSSV